MFNTLMIINYFKAIHETGVICQFVWKIPEKSKLRDRHPDFRLDFTYMQRVSDPVGPLYWWADI